METETQRHRYYDNYITIFIHYGKTNATQLLTQSLTLITIHIVYKTFNRIDHQSK